MKRDGGGIQVIWTITIEREGSDKPCCVAEWLVTVPYGSLGTEEQFFFFLKKIEELKNKFLGFTAPELLSF